MWQNLISRTVLMASCLGILVGAGNAQDSSVRRAEPVKPAPLTSVGSEPNTTRPSFFNSVADDPAQAQGLTIYPTDAPPTVASSAIMIDARTGETILLKNPDVKRPVASTQKLLTALLVVEHGGLDTPVRVGAADCQVEPTKLSFRAGEIYTKRQLLPALLVHSCNDVALCLARNDAGSVPAFAQRMNERAATLRALNSHFVNPNGLPMPGQYSTARDMARIAYVAYHNPTLRQYMRLPAMSFTYNSGRHRILEATNKLIARSSIFTGMKTGYTGPSGRCLVSSASSGGHDVILVQLGGTHNMLFDDAERLLLWGLERRGVGSAELSAPSHI
jgi:D-alanyl-D-alanine carboxypeptidase (penicillin-binding protein 5/6)